MTLLTNFSANEDILAVFWTRLTNILVDARANIKQQHKLSGHSTREVQSTLDRFFTSPVTKRQRPVIEEEETYLEQTSKIWKKKNSKNFVYLFSV
jgi:hypothetical protein